MNQYIILLGLLLSPMNVVLAMPCVGQCTSEEKNELSTQVNKNTTSFVVTLAANPTTGFQWTVINYDKNLLTLSSSIYQRPDTQLIGVGGHMLFTFNLNKGKTYPEQTKMEFKYSRSWEPNTAITTQVTVFFVDSD